jgi:hypothetical protein
LLGAEVRRRENLLHADYLYTLLRGILDKRQVFLDVQTFDFLDRQISGTCVRTLY